MPTSTTTSTPYRSPFAVPTVPHPTPRSVYHDTGSAHTNTRFGGKPAPHPAHAPLLRRTPIRNPYDKFSASEFDDWIGGITSALRRALGHSRSPSPVLDDEDEEREDENAVASALARAADDDEEEADGAAFGGDEGESSDGGVAEDSFAHVMSRRAKGKARDPRDGPGFGNQSQPIELVSDSEEDEQEEEEDEDDEEGEDEEDEEGEEEGEGDGEEGETEEDEEDEEEDANAPGSSGQHALVDYVSSEEESEEVGDWRGMPARRPPVESSEEDEIYVSGVDGSAVDRDGNPLDVAGLDDEDDEEEEEEEHQRSSNVLYGYDDDMGERLSDEDNRRSDDEEDIESDPARNVDEGSPELPDPWALFTGDEALPASLTPSALTPPPRVFSPGLHPRRSNVGGETEIIGGREVEVFTVDSDSDDGGAPAGARAGHEDESRDDARREFDAEDDEAENGVEAERAQDELAEGRNQLNSDGDGNDDRDAGYYDDLKDDPEPDAEVADVIKMKDEHDEIEAARGELIVDGRPVSLEELYAQRREMRAQGADIVVRYLPSSDEDGSADERDERQADESEGEEHDELAAEKDELMSEHDDESDERGQARLHPRGPSDDPGWDWNYPPAFGGRPATASGHLGPEHASTSASASKAIPPIDAASSTDDIPIDPVLLMSIITQAARAGAQRPSFEELEATLASDVGSPTDVDRVLRIPSDFVGFAPEARQEDPQDEVERLLQVVIESARMARNATNPATAGSTGVEDAMDTTVVEPAMQGAALPVDVGDAEVQKDEVEADKTTDVHFDVQPIVPLYHGSGTGAPVPNFKDVPLSQKLDQGQRALPDADVSHLVPISSALGPISSAPDPTSIRAEPASIHAEPTSSPTESSAARPDPSSTHAEPKLSRAKPMSRLLSDIVADEGALTADGHASAAAVEEVDPDIFAPLISTPPVERDDKPDIAEIKELAKEKEREAGVRDERADAQVEARDSAHGVAVEEEEAQRDEGAAVPTAAGNETSQDAKVGQDVNEEAEHVKPAAVSVSEELEGSEPKSHVTFVEKPDIAVDSAEAAEEPEYIVEELDDAPAVADLDDVQSVSASAVGSTPARHYLLLDEESGDWTPATGVTDKPRASPIVEADETPVTSQRTIVEETDDYKDDEDIFESPSIPAPVSADPNVRDPVHRTPSPSPSASESDSPVRPSRGSGRSYTLSAVPASLWKALELEHTSSHSGLFTPLAGSSGTTPAASEDASGTGSDAESVAESIDGGRPRLVPVLPLGAEESQDTSEEATHGRPPAPDASAVAYEGSDLDADGEDDPDYIATPVEEAASATEGGPREPSPSDPFALMGDKSLVAPGAVESAESSGQATPAEGIKDTDRSSRPSASTVQTSVDANGTAAEKMPVKTNGAGSAKANGHSPAVDESTQEREISASQKTEVIDEDREEGPSRPRTESAEELDSSAEESEDEDKTSSRKRKRRARTTADMTATRPVTRSQSDKRIIAPLKRGRRNAKSSGAGKIVVRGKAKVAAKRARADSESGSIASSSSVHRMLASTSRAASVLSSADSVEDAPSPSVTKPVVDFRPPLIHTHTDTFIRHHHGRGPPPPPVAIPARAESKAETPDPSSAETPTGRAPETPSKSQKAGPMQRLPSLNSPVTRSNCRFHKISLPLDDGGYRLHFIVPGCSLSDMELRRDEEIEDLGFASKEDHSKMVHDIESYDFHPAIVSVLRHLVGVDLVREHDLFYLPQAGDPILKKKRRKGRKSLVTRIREATRGTQRPMNSAASSATSRSVHDDDEAGSAVGASSHYQGTASGAGSLTDLESSDEEEEERPAKRLRPPIVEDGAKSISAPVRSSQPLAEDGPQASGSQPPRLRRSKRKTLHSDAAAYKPGKEEEEDSDAEIQPEMSDKRRTKRSRTLEDTASEGPKAKRTRLRKSVSALSPAHSG